MVFSCTDYTVSYENCAAVYCISYILNTIYQKSQSTLIVRPLCGSCCTMMALISHDCHQMSGKLCCSAMLLLLCQIIRIVSPGDIYEHIKHFTARINTDTGKERERERGRKRERGRVTEQESSEIYMLVATLTRILLANSQHRRAP